MPTTPEKGKKGTGRRKSLVAALAAAAAAAAAASSSVPGAAAISPPSLNLTSGGTPTPLPPYPGLAPSITVPEQSIVKMPEAEAEAETVQLNLAAADEELDVLIEQLKNPKLSKQEREAAIRITQQISTECSAYMGFMLDFSGSVESVNEQIANLGAQFAQGIQIKLGWASAFANTDVSSGALTSSAAAENFFDNISISLGISTNAWNPLKALLDFVNSPQAGQIPAGKIFPFLMITDFNWDLPPGETKSVNDYYSDLFTQIQKAANDKGFMVAPVSIGINGGYGVNTALMDAISSTAAKSIEKVFPKGIQSAENAVQNMTDSVCDLLATFSPTVAPVVPPLLSTFVPTAATTNAPSVATNAPTPRATNVTTPSPTTARVVAGGPPVAAIAGPIVAAAITAIIPLLRKRQLFEKVKPEHAAAANALEQAEAEAHAAKVAAVTAERAAMVRKHAADVRAARAAAAYTTEGPVQLNRGAGFVPGIGTRTGATGWTGGIFTTAAPSQPKAEAAPVEAPVLPELPKRRVECKVFVGESTPTSVWWITLVKAGLDNFMRALPEELKHNFAEVDLNNPSLVGALLPYIIERRIPETTEQIREFENTIKAAVSGAVGYVTPEPIKNVAAAAAHETNEWLRWFAFSEAKRMLQPGDIVQFDADTQEILRIARKNADGTIQIIPVASTQDAATFERGANAMGGLPAGSGSGSGSGGGNASTETGSDGNPNDVEEGPTAADRAARIAAARAAANAARGGLHAAETQVVRLNEPGRTTNPILARPTTAAPGGRPVPPPPKRPEGP